MLGIDRFIGDPVRYVGDGARLALLTNQAAVLSDGRPTLEALRASPHAELVRLFTFEHGFSGFGADARPVADDRDPRSGLPRYSLYGPRRRPDPALLSDLDAVVVDVQEVGVRPYTYATTVALLLEAAAEAGTRIVICDRPTLLGPRIAGPPLDSGHRSFLGYLDVPFQHGLTLGEAMRWHADGALGGTSPGGTSPGGEALGGAVDLTVIALSGWRRDRPGTFGPFVPPSPGLPSRDAVALYPGLVLLEGVNVSEGRGTPLPFSLLGAPWLEGYALAEALNRLALPGLWARPLNVRPESGPFAGRTCHGVQLHVTDPAELRAFEAGVRILAHLREHHDAELAWRDAAELPWSRDPDAGRVWHEPTTGPLIDGLTGSTEVRDVVDGRRSLDDALDAWRTAAVAFAAAVEPSLSYGPPPAPDPA